jgi:hypothetical protein
MIRCSTALAPRCFIRTPLRVIRRSPPKSETGAGAGDNVSGNPRKSCLPVQAAEIRAAGEALAALRQTLQDPELASVRGIALAACLITDRNGPLYHCSPGSVIADLATAATAALIAPPVVQVDGLQPRRV